MARAAACGCQRAPKPINIGAVVRDMEDHLDILECFSEQHQKCPLLPGCSLRSVLADARRRFLSILDRHTLQDVLANGLGKALADAKGATIAGNCSAAEQPRSLSVGQTRIVGLNISLLDG